MSSQRFNHGNDRKQYVAHHLATFHVGLSDRVYRRCDGRKIGQAKLCLHHAVACDARCIRNGFDGHELAGTNGSWRQYIPLIPPWSDGKTFRNFLCSSIDGVFLVGKTKRPLSFLTAVLIEFGFPNHWLTYKVDLIRVRKHSDLVHHRYEYQERPKHRMDFFRRLGFGIRNWEPWYSSCQYRSCP